MEGYFELYSAEATKRSTDGLSTLEKLLSESHFMEDKNARLLALPRDSGVYGLSLGAFGLYGIHESALHHPNPNVALFLALHERCHVQIAFDIRDVLLKNHAEIDHFFHFGIIPDWIERRVELTPDQEYLRSKDWMSLFEGHPSFDFSLAKGQDAVDNYFSLLSKGMLNVKNGKIRYHPSPSFSKEWNKAMAQPDTQLNDMYMQSPQDLTVQIMTGYAIAHKMCEYYREHTSRKIKSSLWEWEEGFCNYIAANLARVEIREMNAIVPQDEGKIVLSERIINKRPEINSALARVKGYGSLVDFLSEIDLVRK